MDETETFKAKLDEIDEKIQKARDDLKLRGIFHKDHEATADELARRYRVCARRPRSRAAARPR